MDTVPSLDVGDSSNPMIVDRSDARSSIGLCGEGSREFHQLPAPIAGNPLVVDGIPREEAKQKKNSSEGTSEKGRGRKRKLASVETEWLSRKMDALEAEYRREMDDLFEYYKEVSGIKLDTGDSECLSNNAAIACLLEESSLPFSKLAEGIYEKLKTREGITIASVRSSVLLIGQRMMYGIASENADVLEDGLETCLWCWEARELKLFPRRLRGSLNVRRTARKKIHERISALSGVLSLIRASEDVNNQMNDLVKSCRNVQKVLNLESIRSLVDKLNQKNDSETAAKENKLKEKESIREVKKEMKNSEKEKQKIAREIQKEKLQKEREQKRMQEESEKEAKRREREQAEQCKQLKKQQEEADREQKRREKEQLELKRQLSLKKQANMMQRFLKTDKTKGNLQISETECANAQDTKLEQMDHLVNSATSVMDSILSCADQLNLDELWRSHVVGWRKFSGLNKSRGWGVRRNPKVDVVKELKLQKLSSGLSCDIISTPNRELLPYKDTEDCPSFSKLSEDSGICYEEHVPSNNGNAASSLKRLIKRKLLQFDKSHRPAYYGTWSKKSVVVRPRKPFKMDPNLDYDVDSDEEWEEEDPGESLSDCEKDDEDNVKDEDSKVEEEEESEDGFVVPDDYLSEDEGIQLESELDAMADASVCGSSKQDVDVDEIRILAQRQKILHNFTEEALRKNRPLVICNTSHEKDYLLTAEDLIGVAKIEKLCLQALCMRAYPGGSVIELPTIVNPPPEHEDIRRSGDKTPTASSRIMSDSDFLEVVKLIMSCRHGMSKLVELLQQKFATFSKAQLRSKVREVAEFMDNHWQVKKDILNQLGISAVTPGERPKGIVQYFVKRCLPPEGSMAPAEASPEASFKSKAGDAPRFVDTTFAEQQGVP